MGLIIIFLKKRSYGGFRLVPKSVCSEVILSVHNLI